MTFLTDMCLNLWPVHWQTIPELTQQIFRLYFCTLPVSSGSWQISIHLRCIIDKFDFLKVCLKLKSKDWNDVNSKWTHCYVHIFSGSTYFSYNHTFCNKYEEETNNTNPEIWIESGVTGEWRERRLVLECQMMITLETIRTKRTTLMIWTFRRDMVIFLPTCRMNSSGTMKIWDSAVSQANMITTRKCRKTCTQCKQCLLQSHTIFHFEFSCMFCPSMVHNNSTIYIYYNYRFLIKSTTLDLSDLVDLLKPSVNELDEYSNPPEEFIVSCSFDKKNCSYR